MSEYKSLRVPDSESEGGRTKYFSFLSGLTITELREIAKECKLRNYSRLRKADLISFLDCYCEKRPIDCPESVTYEVVQRCLERWMFPKALEAWVEHFIPNQCAPKHFVQVILHTLSSFTIFEEVKYNEEFMCQPRWCLPNMITSLFVLMEMTQMMMRL